MARARALDDHQQRKPQLRFALLVTPLRIALLVPRLRFALRLPPLRFALRVPPLRIALLVPPSRFALLVPQWRQKQRKPQSPDPSSNQWRYAFVCGGESGVGCGYRGRAPAQLPGTCV